MCLHINLHKYKTRTKVKDFVDTYNNSLPLSSKGRKQYSLFLRQQHTHLIEHLVELYFLELKKSRVHGQAPAFGDRLPSFHTNNAQLSKRMNCSQRTIRNLRGRLKAAGIIESETFHGSNSSYKIWLNPDVLYMSTKETQNLNAVEFFSRPNGLPALRQMQTLPHTVTSLPVQDTNILNKLDGAIIQPSVDNQAVTGTETVENNEKPVEKCLNTVEKPQLVPNRLQETGYKDSNCKNVDTPPHVAAAPPPTAPDSFDEIAEGLSKQEKNALGRFVMAMYRTAVVTLYSDKWLSKSEKDKMMARLAEYLRYAPMKNWKNGANEVMERMVLVRRWIDRHFKKGEYNMMIPSIYFDVRNQRKSSFVNTKKWFKGHKASKKEIADKVLLTKAVNEYFGSFEAGAKYAPAEAYRRISQRLNKRNSDLLKQFHEKITDDAANANKAA